VSEQDIVKVIKQPKADFVSSDFVSSDFKTALSPAIPGEENNVSITESIVAIVSAPVVPPTAPVPQAGGVLTSKRRKRFQTRRMVKRVNLGNRYYLSYPVDQSKKPHTRLSPVQLLDQRKPEPVQRRPTKVTASCTCVYSIATPAPYITDNIILEEKPVIKSVLPLQQRSQSETKPRTSSTQYHTQYESKQEISTQPKILTPQFNPPQHRTDSISKTPSSKHAPQEHLIRLTQDDELQKKEEPPKIKTIVSVNETARYDIAPATISVSTSCTSKYDIHKAISKDHEQQVAFLKRMIDYMDTLDVVDELSA